MKTIGSQKRETLEEAGYKLISLCHGEAILKDDNGKYEVWQENDHFAGYVVEIHGNGFEFCRSM